MLSHCLSIDVRFYELDPYNHVNHTMYLAYCEVARIRALDERNIGLETLGEAGFRMLVIELTAKFLLPAVGGDTLDVFTDVREIGRASSRWEQRIERAGEVLFRLSIRAAITNLDGVPVRLPDFMREAFEYPDE